MNSRSLDCRYRGDTEDDQSAFYRKEVPRGRTPDRHAKTSQYEELTATAAAAPHPSDSPARAVAVTMQKPRDHRQDQHHRNRPFDS